jgi:hypothetical protein
MEENELCKDTCGEHVQMLRTARQLCDECHAFDVSPLRLKQQE